MNALPKLKSNTAELVFDVSCWLFVFLAAVSFWWLGVWKNGHTALLGLVVFLFVIRSGVFAFAEPSRSRREVILIMVPYIAIVPVTFVRLYEYPPMAWVLLGFLNFWFFLLIVYDFVDMRKSQGSDASVEPPSTIQAPEPTLTSVQHSLSKESTRGGYSGGAGADGLRLEIPKLQQADTQDGVAVVPGESQIEPPPQRDAAWFCKTLTTLKMNLNQRVQSSYADLRVELEVHFLKTNLDREVLERHNVPAELVDAIDKGDYKALLKLLRSRSIMNEVLLNDLAQALAEGCKPQEPEIQTRRRNHEPERDQQQGSFNQIVSGSDLDPGVDNGDYMSLVP